MNSVKYLFFLVFTILSTSTALSQTKEDNDKLSLNSGSIDNQFEFVIRRSGSWQEYKTVKKTWLYALKSHTLDSLKAVHKNLVETQTIVNTQAKEIENLQANLSNTQDDLDKTNTEKNNMTLFGMLMSKTKYNVLMWTIISGLLALLLFFIYKFKNSNSITRDAKKALKEIEEEFDEHRKTALEREQKVRRRLQDEINKHKNS